MSPGSARHGVVAIVPARLGASRLPGKPLLDLGGVPMVVRVARRLGACRCVDRVLVASGDPEILAVVRAHGLDAAATPRELPSGTHRVAHAAATLDPPPRVVVNVQGDEPFVDPEHVDAVAGAVLEGAPIATLAAPLDGDPTCPARVKVDLGPGPHARGFSRRPYEAPHWLHLGLYAFRAETLATLVTLPETAGERAERLEQLRWLEHGHPIHVTRVRRAGLSVDTPEDLDRARAALARPRTCRPAPPRTR